MYALKNMPISFPGLFGDWEFTPDPIAIPLGRGIYWYAIFITSGMLLAWWFCSHRAERYGIKGDDLLDGLLIGAPLAVVGARIYYVLFYLDLYVDASGKFLLSRAVAIWDGGLAIYGAVIMVFIVMYFFCRRRKIRIPAVADLVVIGLLIGQIVGRWGNFFNREAFGCETTLPWRMRLWVSASEYVEVHPTFLYESLWNLVGLLLILLVIEKRRRFDGENTCFYFAWYGLGRFWIEGLRTDALHFFGMELFGKPIYVSQMLSLVLFVVSSAVLVRELCVKKRDGSDLWVDRRIQSSGESNRSDPA